MPALSDRAFAKAVRRLDGPEFRAFIADIWAARGYETTIEGARVIATTPETDERTVLLPIHDDGWFLRDHPQPTEGSVDVVVSVDRRDVGARIATQEHATHINHTELRRIVLYAIDRKQCEHLFKHYLDRPPTVAPRTDAGVRRGSRAVWGGLVLVGLFVVASIVAGPAVPWLPASIDGGESDGSETPLQTGPDPGDTLTHPRADLVTEINEGSQTATEPNDTDGGVTQDSIWDRPLPAIGTGDQAWRGFGFDPARTGYTAATIGPVGNVSIDGRVNSEYRIIASPIVVDGRMYVTDFGGNLYAMNAETMEVGWTAQLNGRTTATPTVTNDTLYTATARNTNTGPRTHLGGAASTIHALSATTGRTRWIRAFEPVVLSSPVVVDETLYIGSTRGTIHAIDTTNGSDRWNTSIGGQIFASPAISGDTLYIGSTDGRIVALSVTTGTVTWRFQTEGRVIATPAVGNDTVYVGSADGRLYALDADTGTERWNYSTGAVINSSPAVAEGIVYIGDQDGQITAINATNGTQRWNRTYPGAVLSSPAVVGETVYVGVETLTETTNGTRGGVVALTAETGESEWTVMTNGSVGTSPAVADGSLYIGDYNGFVYRMTGCTELGTESRESVWLATVACR